MTSCAIIFTSSPAELYALTTKLYGKVTGVIVSVSVAVTVRVSVAVDVPVAVGVFVEVLSGVFVREAVAVLV
jgi:hypothetical protein